MTAAGSSSKSKLKPWLFEVAWFNPSTAPPDGQPRVLLSVRRLQASGHPIPAEIERQLQEPGLGYGWCVRCSIDPQWQEAERVRRQSSPEARGRRRRQNLQREAARKAPLFAEKIVSEELERRHAYFFPWCC
jgi:hypothetical protein